MKVILSEIQMKLIASSVNEDFVAPSAQTINSGSAEKGEQIMRAFQDANANMKKLLQKYGVEANGDEDGNEDSNEKDSNTTQNAPNAQNVEPKRSWISTVQKVWGDVFVGPIFRGIYDQSNSVGAQPLRKVGLSRATTSRADCSGFIFTCLQEYGSLPSGAMGNTSTLRNKSFNIPGFIKQRYKIGDYKKLPPGTILVYGSSDSGTRSGHAVILGQTPGRGWSFGSSKRVGTGISGDQPIPTNRPYKFAFIPQNSIT